MVAKIKRGAVAWVIAGGLLFAWSGAIAGGNAAKKDRVKDKTAQAEKLEHFYRVVAGDLSGNEPNQANKLARDLRDIPAERLDSFQGDSNRYGGISNDLGFDPFDGVDCRECGKLDFMIVQDVQAIKDGGLTSVLGRIEGEIKPANTTPGPPILLWAVWLLTLPSYLGVAYVRLRRSEESKYRDFAEERHLVNELREAQRELTPGNRSHALENLITRLEEQIEERVSYKETKTRDMRLEALVEEASDALDAIAAGNKTLD